MLQVSYAQEEKPEDCNSIVNPEIYKYFINEVDEVMKFTAERANAPISIETVPVRFNIYNGPSFTQIINQSHIDVAIAHLNTAYAGTGLNFVQCGPINYIYDDRLNNSANYLNFQSRFSYTSGTLEVVISKINYTASPSPCPNAFQDVNPNYYDTGYCSLYDNILKIGDLNSLLSSSLPHETGHHFGLFHTFMNPDVNRHTPVDPDQFDHPYPVLDLITGEIIPNWWGRELVIRQPEPTSSLKPFKNINYLKSGDLVADTPPDCNPYASGIYPGCPLSAQIIQMSGCLFDNTLTYKDYNEDAIYPPSSGLSLGLNLMSYWKESCRSQLTQGQRDRILYYYTNYRKEKYAPEKCGSFNDKVEFEGSELGIPLVTIRTRHSSDARLSNVTTDLQGAFSGLLFNNMIKARVYHNGLGNFTPPITQNQVLTDTIILNSRYLHTPCEWSRGVTTADLLAIQRHILGLEPLSSGYSIIAADANKSNTVTTYDVVELRKLILGIYSSLPAFEQPWRFVPEFIPQDNSTAFNTNPFNMTITGNNVGAAYLEQDWEFTIPASLSKRGFDAIKIGDVNASWPTATDCATGQKGIEEDEESKPIILVPSIALNAEDEILLKFKIGNFSNISAFQLGLRLDPNVLEIINIDEVTQQLSEYNKTDYFKTESDSGYVRTLWIDTSLEGKYLSQNATVFSINAKAKVPVSDLQSAIVLEERALPAMFWNNASTPEKAENVSVEVSVVNKTEERSTIIQPSTEQVLRCFPNPFSDKAYIVFDHEGLVSTGKLIVTSISGRHVLEQNIKIEPGRNIFTVHDLAAFDSGAYQVTLFIGDVSHQIKIIKK